MLGLSEAQVLARSREPAPAKVVASFHELLERRLAGEPVAYLRGEREFFGRRFQVDSRALIPRPETEHLIEAALEISLPPAPRILDVGTGTGAIAVTLALEIPQARLLATDLSLAALALGDSNARAHAVSERVAFVASELLSALDLTRIDLLVSNPPYIDPAIASELSAEVTGFEPGLALFAANRGRAIGERLIGESGSLRPGTPVLLEIGYDQAGALTESCERSPLELREIHQDLAGHDRLALLTRR